MRTNKFLILLFVFATLLVGCKDEVVDKEKPTIDISKSEFQNCTVVTKGVPFTFTAEVSDNMALGSYSFDIHHNFDHHTHSTETELKDCDLGDIKEPINPYKLITESKVIPNAPKTHTITETFVIPEEYEAGDYHFMVKVVDKNGWATLKGLSFKVVDNNNPEEEIIKENKIAKIRIIMHEGHLHGANFHGNPQIAGSPLRKRQELILVKTHTGWQQEAHSSKGDTLQQGKPFIAKGINLAHELTEDNPGGRYAVEIILYDKDGNRLNEEYAANAKKFQIFFTVNGYTENATQKKVTANNANKDIFDYTYRDTDPSDKMLEQNSKDVTLLNNKIQGYGNLGLKGYFAMKKSRASYQMNVHIVEWLKGEKTKDLNFNHLPKAGKTLMITEFSLPINVLIQNAYDDTQEAEMNEIMGKYFGMTADEYEELEVWGDNNSESSQYWM